MGLAGLIVPSENGTSWSLVTWSNKKESIVEKVDDSWKNWWQKRMRMDKNQQELIYIHRYIHTYIHQWLLTICAQKQDFEKTHRPRYMRSPFWKSQSARLGTGLPQRARRARLAPVPAGHFDFFKTGDRKGAPRGRFPGFIYFVSRHFSLFPFPFSPFSATLLNLNLLRSPSYSQDQSDFPFRSEF